MQIEIHGWDDHNPRHDLKSVHWVRIESDIASNSKLFNLTPEEKWFWVFLLSLAGKQNNGGLIDAEPDYLAHHSGLTEPAVLKALDRLSQKKMVTTRTDTNEYVRIKPSLSQIGPYGTNETNGTNGTEDKTQEGSFKSSALLDAWNEHRGPLSAIQRLTKGRLDKIKARRAEAPVLAYWVECIKRLASSDFCTGKNDRGWKADFDWLIKNDSNHVKVTEGRYANKGAKKQPDMKVFTSEDFQ